MERRWKLAGQNVSKWKTMLAGPHHFPAALKERNRALSRIFFRCEKWRMNPPELTAVSVPENVGLVLEIFFVRRKFFRGILLRFLIWGGFIVWPRRNLVPLQRRSLRARNGDGGGRGSFPVRSTIRTEIQRAFDVPVPTGKIYLFGYRRGTTESNVNVSQKFEK